MEAKHAAEIFSATLSSVSKGLTPTGLLRLREASLMAAFLLMVNTKGEVTFTVFFVLRGGIVN
jgi:hypothetical protein